MDIQAKISSNTLKFKFLVQFTVTFWVLKSPELQLSHEKFARLGRNVIEPNLITVARMINVLVLL